jgi:hemolysin activation/secretion protein
LGSLGALALGGAALADPPNPSAPTREQLAPAEQAPAPKRAARIDLLRRIPPPICTLPTDSPVTFTLEGVDVTGAEVPPVWAEFVGKTVRIRDLCEIQSRIYARLYDHDPLALVIIPPQTIDAHARRIRFQVVHAHLAALRFHGDVGPAQAKVEAVLDHLRGLTPFDLPTFERFLLLARDIPGIRVETSFAHAQEPGLAPNAWDVDFSLSRTPLDEVVQFSNANSAILGPYTGLARVDFNSFTPLGERTTLLAYTTLNNLSQVIVQALEEVRLGDNGVFARASFTYGYSHPGDSLAALDLHGGDYVGTIEVDDPLIRRIDLNLTVAGGMDLINQRTDQPGGAPLSDDALRVIWARADTDARHDFGPSFLGGAVTLTDQTTVQVRKGFHALGASANGAANLSRPQGESDAWVVRGEDKASLDSGPTKGLPWTLTNDFIGQWADRPLLAYEQQAIGNLTIGRGYDPAAATGDRVVADEVKLRFGPFDVHKYGAVAPYAFYDIAQVNSLAIGVENVNLRSLGGGLELWFRPWLHADVYYAKPLDRPYPGDTSKPPARVLFTLTLTH